MFRTSEQTDKLFDALVSMQSELEPAPKDSENPHFRSKYANLSAIFSVSRPIMAKYGLGIIQANGRSPEGMARTSTRIIHKSNQWIESDLDLKSIKDDPQAFGSAFTYGRRYSAQAMLGVIAEEDDDGNAASHKPKPAVKQAVEQKTQPLPKEKPDLAVEWANAVAAFKELGKKEADLKAYLNEVYGAKAAPLTPDHMGALRNWYDELRKEVWE